MRIRVILSFDAAARNLISFSRCVILVPWAVGFIVLFNSTSIPASRQGSIVEGWSIFAPKYAISAACEKLSSAIVRVSFTYRGSPVCIPSMSVHICTSEHSVAAPISAAE